ncbi:MAG: acyltransferase [Caldilineaceae bacterium]
MSKIFRVLSQELEGAHPRLRLAYIGMALLPPYVGGRLRTYLLRMSGFQIGHGTVFWGAPTIVGFGNLYEQLHIGEGCWFNMGCFLNPSAAITIGDRVALGQQVMILTDGHAIGDRSRRAGALEAKSVAIGDGAWLSTRCTILPGVTIGAGAVVAAGAVVTKSVAPHTLVGGVPARVIRELPTGADLSARKAILDGLADSVVIAPARAQRYGQTVAAGEEMPA